MSKILNVVSNTAKVVTATMIAGVAADSAFHASGDCVNNAKKLAGLINPEPVYVKKGLFHRKQTVKVNPFTGKVSSYTGAKIPKCKKAIKIKKGGVI